MTGVGSNCPGGSAHRGGLLLRSGGPGEPVYEEYRHAHAARCNIATSASPSDTTDTNTDPVPCEPAISAAQGGATTAEAGAATGGPPAEVEYDWVTEFAEKKYEGTLEERRGLDDKAASIITYLSSGAGLATLGSILALSANRVDSVTALLMLPAIGMAFLSIHFAMAARMVRTFWSMPSVDDAVKHAEYWVTAKEAKRQHLKTWQEVLSYNDPMHAEKASQVQSSMRWFFRSVLALLIPLGYCVVSQWNATPPQQSIIIQMPATSPAP